MHVSQVVVWGVCGLITGLLLWVGAGAFFTDPYFQWTMVQSPFQTRVNTDGKIELIELFPPKFSTHPFMKLTALARAGARIVMYRRLPERPLGSTAPEVLRNLHTIRFQPTKPYVITGAHYSDLYVRNLGIFFNELTSQDIYSTPEDLQDRQRMALQTVALDLAFLQHNQRLVTTIVPLGGRTFTGINIYEEPSDALHAILYTLQKLEQHPATRDAALQLQEQYRQALEQEVTRYITTVIDPTTLMVNRSIRLSSARDGVKREGAFYDTLIAWKTLQLAAQQNLLDSTVWPAELQPLTKNTEWKRDIINTYWREELGFFANDLSTAGDHFSGDSLFAFSSGFLDPAIPEDLQKLEKMVQFIHTEKLDAPFPLKYSRTNTQNEMQPAVKFFAPGYMGEGMWSHWGMEYVKLLGELGNLTLPDSCEYLQRGEKYLKQYRQNIEQFGGYPELYGSDGKTFETAAVKAVLHNGWVVNYEAAQARLDEYLRTTSCQF